MLQAPEGGSVRPGRSEAHATPAQSRTLTLVAASRRAGIDATRTMIASRMNFRTVAPSIVRVAGSLDIRSDISPCISRESCYTCAILASKPWEGHLMKRILLTLPAVLAAALALALGSSGNPTTAPASIVVVGDSITSGITSPIAWPSLLTIWHEVPVYNQGVPSNQTSQMLARFSDVLATGGQEVVIMGGTNDCYYDHDPATAVANIDAMVTQAKAAGRTVLLVGPIPRDQTDSLGGSMQPCLLTLRADLDAYAASHGAVTFADPWKRFGGSHINRSLYEDLGGIWVHPDAHGAFVLARVVADAMGWRFKGD